MLSVVGSKCEQQVEQLRAQLNERILVLDGGMGTMIQAIVCVKTISAESALPTGLVT